MFQASKFPTVVDEMLMKMLYIALLQIGAQLKETEDSNYTSIFLHHVSSIYMVYFANVRLV